MKNELDFIQAACTVCHKYQFTKDMYLCDGCYEPVCEADSAEGENETRYCTDCIALSKLARELER